MADSGGNCKLCPMEFSGSLFLKNHMIHYHGYSCLFNKVYQCTCKFESIDHAEEMHCHLMEKKPCAQQMLSSYMVLTGRTKLAFQCCSIEFNDNLSFIEHLTEHHMRFFRCTVCQHSSLIKKEIQTHVLQHPANGNIFSSKLCDLKFSSEAESKKHALTHPGVYFCHKCNLQFKGLCEWGQHLIIHEDGATIRSNASYYLDKIICNLCLKQYNSSYELKNHLWAQNVVRVEPDATERELLEKQLKPSQSMVLGKMHWTCGHCFCKGYEKLDAEKHLLAHTTPCCLQCDYKSEYKKYCPDHYQDPEAHAEKKPHRIVLNKYQVGPSLVFRYACFNCPLTFNEEKSTSVIQSHMYCARCPFSALSKSALLIHDLTHHNLDACFGCPVCPDEKFSNLDELQSHLDRPHPLQALSACIKTTRKGPVWRCQLCPAEGRDGLVAHLKDHPVVSCPLCEAVLDPEEARQHLVRQMRKKTQTHTLVSSCTGIQTSEAFQCNFCPRVFRTPTDVDQHVVDDHKNRCRFCSLLFETRLELMMHLKSHEEVRAQLTCGKCFFVILDRERLLRHEKDCEPRGRRKSTCRICKKHFAYEEDRNSHEERSHFNGGRHRCPVCGLKHKTKLVLLNHLRFVHRSASSSVLCDCTRCQNFTLEQSSAEDFEHFWTCELCGEIFVNETNFEKHYERKHNTRGPWYCHKCNIIYKEKKFFAAHIASHDAYKFTPITPKPT